MEELVLRATFVWKNVTEGSLIHGLLNGMTKTCRKYCHDVAKLLGSSKFAPLSDYCGRLHLLKLDAEEAYNCWNVSKLAYERHARKWLQGCLQLLLFCANCMGSSDTVPSTSELLPMHAQTTRTWSLNALASAFLDDNISNISSCVAKMDCDRWPVLASVTLKVRLESTREAKKSSREPSC